MHPELETLVCAYDATGEASGPNVAQCRAVFESLMADALAKHPGLNHETLLNMIRLTHGRWVRRQQNPPTLPPTA